MVVHTYKTGTNCLPGMALKLLIFASWVARISNLSHRCPARKILFVSLMFVMLFVMLFVWVFVYLSFFCGPEVWTQGLHLKPLHQSFFCDGFFQDGCLKLFAQAGFQPWSAWSLPPECLGLQVWASSAQQIKGIFVHLNIPFSFPLVRLGLELMSPHLPSRSSQSRHSTTWFTPPVLFSFFNLFSL
jgi:hypothetical protein